ncbi:outer membrane beta-barrel protein [Hymenobacter sp. BT635]|uniref:Outer membrane beta-barrel protein n=1 Tax=Hymenobacter nitidus TaxID=2880929 RepID=A0ABS8ALU2_9BACT|nr:outer membrane beta-barrel protein [Hymenobacter nitidus]MCB2380195.1 outer membrane beta-barrel protein [Hymenobacter nitidus]
MRNFIWGAAVLTLLTHTAQAQLGPGTILLGGSLGYSQQSREGALDNTDRRFKLNKSIQFAIGPTAGYFLTDNLALGVSADYSITGNTQYQYLIAVPVFGTGPGRVVENGTIEMKTRRFNVGPMARYYAFVGEKAAFFGHLGAGYQGFRSESISASPLVANDSESLTTGSGYYAQLAPGFVFFPSAKLGLEVSLQGLLYRRTKNETTRDDLTTPTPLKSTSSRFEAGIGLSNLQIGAAFYLGR